MSTEAVAEMIPVGLAPEMPTLPEIRSGMVTVNASFFGAANRLEKASGSPLPSPACVSFSKKHWATE
jgi:hypothetical protein